MAGISSRLGQDFSQVRVHEGNQANAVGATAYTGGSNIHLGAGQASAGASAGNSLMAHELSHIIQQGTAKPADIQAAVGHYAD